MVDVGAHVDLGPIHFAAELTAAVKDLANVVRDLERAYSTGSYIVPIRGGNVSSSGSVLTPVDLGGPQYGREWQVRNVVLGGVTWATMRGGTGLLVVSPAQPAAAPNLADIVWATAFPGANTWGGRQISLTHPNHLWFCATGVDATAAYLAGGSVEDMPDIYLRAQPGAAITRSAV